MALTPEDFHNASINLESHFWALTDDERAAMETVIEEHIPAMAHFHSDVHVAEVLIDLGALRQGELHRFIGSALVQAKDKLQPESQHSHLKLAS